MPRPDYPKDIREFRRKFSTDKACLDYLSECRWPEGFICPKCSNKISTKISTRYLFQCGKCRTQTSPTSSTIMHRSHIPIQEWFWAAYLMATHTPGISALQIQRQVGIVNYRNAWHMLHRLRQGMVNESRTKLSGLVEVDESFIGGPAKGKKGRGVVDDENKSLIVGAVEVLKYVDKNGKDCEKAGRLRLQLIKNANEKTLGEFLTQNVEQKSRVRTDGWKGYSDAALEDFIHHVRIVGKGQLAHKKFKHIHRVFGNLKTWINGTHHGVEPKHLASYMNEFIFRFNRRKTPMAAFQTLLGISAQKKPLPIEKLMSAESKE
jgi:transposase-like protein